MDAARLALLAVTAALVAGALPASAGDGVATAAAIEYDAAASQEGRLAMLFARDVVAGQGPQDDGARPWIDLRASSVTGVEYEDRRAEAAAPATPFVFPGLDGEKKDTPFEFREARAHLTEFQPAFEIHVYAMDGTIEYALQSSGGRFLGASEARMDPGGFGEGAVQGKPPEEKPRVFARVERPGPWVVHSEAAPQLAVTLTGDFVVEMVGITLQVEGDGKEGTLRSGRWESPLDPNAPPEASDVAYSVTKRFVRIHLEDAVLEFATEGGQPKILWAAGGVTADFAGRAALVDAYGTVESVELDHQRHVLPESSRVRMDAQPEGPLAVEVSRAPLAPSEGTLASVAAPASAALIGTGAVLALGAAIGIGLLRRLLRLPALADVETAIEEGEYRKAARLAARILARLPGSEEALLGRAIALSKSGRHQEVVAELTRHLAERPASDGTLHYVLGLAQLDSGRPAEGQASLREAVRLTPSLLGQVAPRLGKVFSVAPMTTKETHGYA